MITTDGGEYLLSLLDVLEVWYWCGWRSNCRRLNFSYSEKFYVHIVYIIPSKVSKRASPRKTITILN